MEYTWFKREKLINYMHKIEFDFKLIGYIDTSLTEALD